MSGVGERGVVPRVHVVTDDEVLRRPGFTGTAAALLAAGEGELALHVRGHRTGGRELHRIAIALAGAGGPLLVNDRVDVALAAGASGVQLGRRSIPIAEARGLLGPGRLIGASVHAAEEAVSAGEVGADFVVLGTVFPSTSHPARVPSGLEPLRRAALATEVPILAIGGVTPERTRDVLAAGAHGVAVLGAVWNADDPLAAAARFLAWALARKEEEIA